MTDYIQIDAGYAYAKLRVGLVLRAPNGREVYCRPGDDQDNMLANIEALDGCRAEIRSSVVNQMLGEYFS